eukprot:1138380-Pelagomonas_calceolata.AAC.1
MGQKGVCKKGGKEILCSQSRLSLHQLKKRRRSGSKEPPFPSTTKQEQRGLLVVGTWRVARSARLQNLAVRSILAFNSAPSAYKVVGVLDRNVHEVHVQAC